MHDVLGNTLNVTEPSMDIATGHTHVKYDTEVDQINTHKSYTKLFFFIIQRSRIIATQMSETSVLYLSRDT
jgi:hypothetical protein